MRNLRAPDFAAGLRVKRVEIAVAAADEHQTAPGHQRAAAVVRRPEALGQGDAAQQRMIAQRLIAFAERHAPRDLAFVQIDGRQYGVRR